MVALTPLVDWHLESSLTKQGAAQSPALSCTRGHGETNTTKEGKKEVQTMEDRTHNGGEKRGVKDFVVTCIPLTLHQYSNHLCIQHPDTKAIGRDKKTVGKKNKFSQYINH